MYLLALLEAPGATWPTVLTYGCDCHSWSCHVAVKQLAAALSTTGHRHVMHTTGVQGFCTAEATYVKACGSCDSTGRTSFGSNHNSKLSFRAQCTQSLSVLNNSVRCGLVMPFQSYGMANVPHSLVPSLFCRMVGVHLRLMPRCSIQ